MNATPENHPVEPAKRLRERWPQVLRYPLQPAAFVTVVVLAVAHLLVYLPVVGIFLDLIVWAALFKYAFEVLRWTANGRESAPEVALSVSDTISIYAVLLLVLVEVVLYLVGMWYGMIAQLVLGVVLMFAMPAMMMILALEEGIARALNPIAWLMIAARIGNPYYLLVGFFFATLLMQSVVATAVNSVVPFLLAMPLVYCVVNYLMIANFHLIGSVIHEHRDELGYTGHLQLSDEVPYTDPSRTILDAARGRAASGDTQGAAALLRDELGEHPDMLPLHDEYRHWLNENDAKAELVAHGKQYIPVLLARDQDRRAIEVARECQIADSAFALDKAEDVSRLAHAAADAGQTQVAMGLLGGFHKRFRNHPDIGRNYLLAARLWAERMNKEMQARAMLNQIKVMMPNDPVIPEVNAYLAFLDTVATTPAKTAVPKTTGTTPQQ
ncbi:MAG: hypothetical protein WBV39_06695 [Rudaea sp.]